MHLSGDPLGRVAISNAASRHARVNMTLHISVDAVASRWGQPGILLSAAAPPIPPYPVDSLAAYSALMHAYGSQYVATLWEGGHRDCLGPSCAIYISWSSIPLPLTDQQTRRLKTDENASSVEVTQFASQVQLTPVATSSGYLIEGTASIAVPASGSLQFLGLGPYSFSPATVKAVLVPTADLGTNLSTKGIPLNDSSIKVSERLFDALYPLKLQTWKIDRALLSSRSNHVHITKNWTDENVHPFWLQVILLNDTSMLSYATPLRRQYAGTPLSALPVAVRNKSFTPKYVDAQRLSLMDPILTNLPNPTVICHFVLALLSTHCSNDWNILQSSNIISCSFVQCTVVPVTPQFNFVIVCICLLVVPTHSCQV